MSRTITPDDIVQSIVQRRWLILVPFAIGIALAPFLSRFAPERYRSETLIMVVPQRVPESYVKATTTESIEDRLPSISEQILSRSRLERIITDMDLYKDQRARQVMEDVVADMRKDVTVTLVGGNSREESADSFRLAYVSDNAETARKVAERLASLYIEQNLKDRENQAESTSQFLETQLEQAKRRLVEHEEKLEDYRRQHAGELPTQVQGNLQAIQNASMQLQQLNESLHRALERRLLIERQIADTEALPVASAPVPAPTPSPVDAAQPSTAARQLEAAKGQLALMLQRFTPDHPEVRTMQEVVKDLQQRADGEAPLNTLSPADPVQPEKVVSPAELAQQKRILDLKAELAVIDQQVTTVKAEDARLKQTIAAYQSKVDVLPSRESELVELTRDYGTLQTAYTSLLMKREDSMMAANLERRQIGEQFRILDPASKPEKPFNQVQRIGIMASGAGVGLVLGLLVIGLLEFKDSSFRREEDIMTTLSLPVLALVPTMVSDGERRHARRRLRWMDLAGSTLLIAAIAVVVYWRLRS